MPESSEILPSLTPTFLFCFLSLLLLLFQLSQVFFGFVVFLIFASQGMVECSLCSAKLPYDLFSI